MAEHPNKGCPATITHGLVLRLAVRADNGHVVPATVGPEGTAAAPAAVSLSVRTRPTHGPNLGRHGIVFTSFRFVCLGMPLRKPVILVDRTQPPQETDATSSCSPVTLAGRTQGHGNIVTHQTRGTGRIRAPTLPHPLPQANHGLTPPSGD